MSELDFLALSKAISPMVEAAGDIQMLRDYPRAYAAATACIKAYLAALKSTELKV